MARTQAVYYRDPNGVEPFIRRKKSSMRRCASVDRFIDRLLSMRATNIDEDIEEYLNGRSPDAPPPEFPITSQVDGELRELRVRFGNVRYRVLYQAAIKPATDLTHLSK